MNRSTVLQIACIALTVLLISCGGPNPTDDLPPAPIGETLFNEDTVFEVAMVQTGIAKILLGKGEYTLFYPNPEKLVMDLQETGLTEEEFLALDNLEEILGYHVAIGTYN